VIPRKKYVPNVPSLHRICESNYNDLVRLLPDCETETQRYQFSVNAELHYQITTLECATYTTMLEIVQHSSSTQVYLCPKMKVRLYHDAKMAEVVSVQQLASLKPSYAYPNDNMHQPNEKEMVNCFLAEWLHFCQQQLGCIVES
jgi:uncharacterized protein YqiB (DUF1249 family)